MTFEVDFSTEQCLNARLSSNQHGSCICLTFPSAHEQIIIVIFVTIAEDKWSAGEHYRSRNRTKIKWTDLWAFQYSPQICRVQHLEDCIALIRYVYFVNLPTCVPFVTFSKCIIVFYDSSVCCLLSMSCLGCVQILSERPGTQFFHFASLPTWWLISCLSKTDFVHGIQSTVCHLEGKLNLTRTIHVNHTCPHGPIRSQNQGTPQTLVRLTHRVQGDTQNMWSCFAEMQRVTSCVLSTCTFVFYVNVEIRTLSTVDKSGCHILYIIICFTI